MARPRRTAPPEYILTRARMARLGHEDRVFLANKEQAEMASPFTTRLALARRFPSSSAVCLYRKRHPRQCDGFQAVDLATHGHLLPA